VDDDECLETDHGNDGVECGEEGPGVPDTSSSPEVATASLDDEFPIISIERPAD
jgi:hypothetical protein